MKRKINILLIEDNIDDVNIMKDMFTDITSDKNLDISFKLNVAEDLETASNLLKIFLPEVILLDLNLPDSNAEETINSVKKITSSKMPIIILSGLDDKEIVNKALHSGFQDYILKDKMNPYILFRSITYSIERFKLHNELMDSKEELENFAYTIAHDLKQPLSSAIMSIRLIEKLYENGKTDELHSTLPNFINVSEKNLVSMINIIDKLFYYYSAARNEKKFNIVCLKDCIKEAINNLQSLIDESETLIEYEENLPYTYGDYDLITLIFQNLFANSIKYKGEDKPKIEVQCKIENQKILVKVSDNGIGIDEEYLEEVFKIFNRANQSKEKSGFGIGLATCKKIADIHNGNIWVNSKKGLGSNFYFTLPYYETNSP